MSENRKLIREAVGLSEFRARLCAFVQRANSGDEIVITKSGRALARLVPMDNQPGPRIPGRGKGAWRVRSDFDAPLPDDFLDACDGAP